MDEYTATLERGVLGLGMWEREDFVQLAAALDAEAFADPRHRALYAALASLAADPARPVFDPSAVALELQRTGRLAEAGGAGYVGEVSVAEVDRHKLGQLVAGLAEEVARRQAAAALADRAERARQRAVPLEALAGEVRGIATRVSEAAAPAERSWIGDALEALLERFEHPERDPGLPTGIPELDEQIGGLARGSLITIAGATSSGKSSLASQIALGAAYAAARHPGRFGAAEGKVAPVLLFSYEMPREELYLRWVAQCSPIEGSFQRGYGWSSADKPRAVEGARRVATLPLHVVDHAGSTVEEIAAEVARFAAVEGRPSLVIVDYIGLLTTPGITNEVQGIGHITQGLKAIAREHDIPVLALAQINREAAGREGRNGHRPRLSDLRSSGSIENDSNVVIFVYRESYYIADPEERRRIEAHPVPVEITVAKNRSGRTGTIVMTWVGHRFLFVPDPEWTSAFGPSMTAGPFFIAYPNVTPAAAPTPEQRVADAVREHVIRTGRPADRAVLLAAFGLSAKAKWIDTSVLAPTVEAMLRAGTLLSGPGEHREARYWLPGQFPAAQVALDAGGVADPAAPGDADDALVQLFD